MNACGGVDRHNWHTSLTFARVLCPRGGLWPSWKPILPLPRPRGLDIRADHGFFEGITS